MGKDRTRIVEEIRKTPEYKALIELDLEDITTAKNARRGSIFFATCLPSTTGRCFEYSIYSSGYLRLYNPLTTRYAMCGQYHLERIDVDGVLIQQYVELMKMLPRIYNRKAKKEGLFEELKFMKELEDVKLPLYTSHPWKFSYTKKLFLERLKTRAKVTEAEIV